MRVILDANVWISYLLAPESKRTITTVVEACFQEQVELVIPQELLDEIRASVGKSRYLRERISEDQLEQLQEILSWAGQIPPKLSETFPQYTADPDDDYLVAYAVVHDVDFLVTGDPHLLVLSQVESTKIITPAQFVGNL